MNPAHTANQAMNAVMTGNRAAWLDCFSENAVLRDPVGGSPLDPHGTGLVGKDALGRFWDAVVQPAQRVHFKVREEYVTGRSVARVADVEVDRGPAGTLQYAGVFVYDLDSKGQIEQLRGYFQIPEL